MSWRRLRTSAAAVQYGAAETSPAPSETAVTGAPSTGTCTRGSPATSAYSASSSG